MKKFISLLLLILATSYLLHNSNIFAQSDENSSEVTDEEVKENIKERLERVSGQDDEGGDTLSASDDDKRAWVGTLDDLTEDTLTIKTNGDSKQAKISEDTTVINEDRQVIKPENLEIDSFVIAMGFLDSNDILDTRRIVVTEKPTPTNFSPFFVEIVDIDDEILQIQDQSDESYDVEMDDDVIITQTVDGEQADIELTDLKKGDKLILVAEPDSKSPGILQASAIHLINGREILAEPEEADEQSNESDLTNEEEVSDEE